VEANRGIGDKLSLILIFGTGWRWVVNFTLRSLYPLEGTLVAVEKTAECATEPA
jgi:hypothetical protein